MAYGYAFSHKAAKKANAKLQVGVRGTKAQPSKMAAFESKNKDDEQGANRQEIPAREINHPTNQGGSATYGRHVSKGGGIGKAESQERTGEINRPNNKKTWPKGGDVKASNPKTGNTRMKGGMAGSNGNPGNSYSGGATNRNG